MEYKKILNKDYRRSLGKTLSINLDSQILPEEELIVHGFWGTNLFNCIIGIPTTINPNGLFKTGVKVYKNCKCGIVDLHGNIIIPFEFKAIVPFDTFIIANRNDMYELYRLNGSRISGLYFNKYKEQKDGSIELYTVDTWETGILFCYYELSKDGILTKISSDGDDWSEKADYGDPLDAYEGDESNRWNTD